MLYDLLSWVSNQLPSRICLCTKCDDRISLYASWVDNMCGSCRAQWLERSKGCKDGDQCISCHQARVGIELTFRKDYAERCFGCLFKPAIWERAVNNNAW